jgi:5'(3')-deoxyribonucleotidase
MRIGIDIDGTLNNLSEIVRAIRLHEDNVILDETKYTLFPDLNKEQIDNFNIRHSQHLIDWVQPQCHSIESINQLSKYHDLFIITARNSSYDIENTLTWFEKHNFNLSNFKSLLFDCHNKVHACKNKNIDIMIDDAPEHLHSLYNHQIHTIRFDHLYNQTCPCTYHTNDWREIVKILMR